MKSAINDILGETSGDTITLTFTLTLDGSAFPNDSTWLFSAKGGGTTITESGTPTDNVTSTDVVVVIGATKTTKSGVYTYALTETTSGGAKRTAVRGKLHLDSKL